MKFAQISALLVLAIAPAHSAVVYNFEGENTINADPDNRNPLSSVWVQTGANGSFNSTVYPISFAQDWTNSTAAGTKGGAIGQLVANSTDATVSVAAPLPAETLLNTKVTTTIAINDSTAGFSTRDSFGMVIHGSGGQTLGSITFTPVDVSTAGLSTSWAISYTTSTGVQSIATPIPSGTELNLSLTFLASGVELAYKYADNSSSNAVYYTPTSYNTAGTLTDIGFSTTQSGPSTQWGTSNNFLRFDNITTSTVPEASSFALAALAGLGFLRRRRA